VAGSGAAARHIARRLTGRAHQPEVSTSPSLAPAHQ
jgi:hypothetical protein